MKTLFDLIVHVYLPLTRKRIASLSFEQDVRSRLGVDISDDSLDLSCFFVDFWGNFSDYELLQVFS